MTLRWITLEDTDSSRLIKQITHSSAASRLRPGKASPMSESNDTTTRTLADTEWDAVTGGSTVGALGYTIHIPMGLPVIRGVVSDARALASISACSHCLRVCLFR
jgi:hypothetical protein